MSKLAADEPDAHGVEWFSFTNPRGQVRKRLFPSQDPWPTSNEVSRRRNGRMEKNWVKKRLSKTSNRKRRPSEKQKPDPTAARSSKRVASRFY